MNILKTALSVVLFISLCATTKHARAQQADHLKTKNAVPINNATEVLKKLNPVSFNYNSSETQYGFHSAEVKAAVPGIVKVEHKLIPSGKNSFKNQNTDKVDMLSLVPFLVSSLKEQQLEIEKLKSELQELRKQVNAPK